MEIVETIEMRKSEELRGKRICICYKSLEKKAVYSVFWRRVCHVLSRAHGNSRFTLEEWMTMNSMCYFNIYCLVRKTFISKKIRLLLTCKVKCLCLSLSVHLHCIFYINFHTFCRIFSIRTHSRTNTNKKESGFSQCTYWSMQIFEWKISIVYIKHMFNCQKTRFPLFKSPQFKERKNNSNSSGSSRQNQATGQIFRHVQNRGKKLFQKE